MKLQCYALQPNPPRLIPARAERLWMDRFPSRHAYRCLPLSIANTYGWEVLSPAAFTILWSGGPDAKDLIFTADESFPGLNQFVKSNFNCGIVTFHPGYLFRTEPGWNLLATGPLNEPKDGIAPLTGIIETSWLPDPFTMNWQMTRAGVVSWRKDEPFCTIFPVAQEALETVQPEILSLDSDAKLHAEYQAWRQKREDFMARFRAGDEATLKEAWQKYYFNGVYPSDPNKRAASHKAKVRLASPVDKRPIMHSGEQRSAGGLSPQQREAVLDHYWTVQVAGRGPLPKRIDP
jgi:hypothetical protein